MSDALRPKFHRSLSASEFQRWYWPVEELKQACDLLGVRSSGLKADLRERVYQKLSNPNASLSHQKKTPKTSRFYWSKSVLSKETIITDNISFGPNVRSFFKTEIGNKFVCHGDFMAWMRANIGSSLGDAIEAWHMLEARKDDPEFRRDIASCNNYLQYLRDIRDANPLLTLDEAKQCWDAKKLRPAQGGFVVYEEADLRFLSN